MVSPGYKKYNSAILRLIKLYLLLFIPRRRNALLLHYTTGFYYPASDMKYDDYILELGIIGAPSSTVPTCACVRGGW